MYRWLEVEEVIEVNPFHKLNVTVRLPKRLPRALSEQEVTAVFDKCAQTSRKNLSRQAFSLRTTRVCLLFMLVTGVRVTTLQISRPDLTFV